VRKLRKTDSRKGAFMINGGAVLLGSEAIARRAIIA
jgi:hypothetical protein